ncbi:MAG: SIMPL domain-containing protein [Symplocastrum torsivum CPER-KK1]|jgi:hypothetical protein|uniref:SIMPL domain-containing protein n=1 Tax=Symplocastrum torsivum CPER-KK1 TaxID=450513 RepID=A0A951PG41_9CYAN|nr:SIMPL domain-containing protein [Symplocastrum torsivum CPER-KK1]
MNKISVRLLVLATMVAGLGAASNNASAASLATSQDSHSDKVLTTTATEEAVDSPDRDRLIAQLFYPSVSDRQGLMVQGQGRASAPADRARLEFQFTNNFSAFGEVVEGESSSSETPESATPAELEPITQATLKPVVDALVARGIPASAIEVNISPTNSSAFPFPFPFPTSSGTAQILVTLDTPTRERVQEVVTVGGDPKTLGENVTIQTVNVSYTVSDCQPLEKAAYVAAVNDARNRARALSEALGVRIAEIPSVAEAPFAGFLPSAPSSSCNAQGSSLPFPFNGLQQPYDPSVPATVEVKKDIFATYAIR